MRSADFSPDIEDLGAGKSGLPCGASGRESACQCERHERHRFSLSAWRSYGQRA